MLHLEKKVQYLSLVYLFPYCSMLQVSDI